MAVADDDADALAVAAWDRIRKVVQDAQNYERRNLWAALQFFLINDEYHDHMAGDLRTVANVLFRYHALARNRASHLISTLLVKVRIARAFGLFSFQATDKSDFRMVSDVALGLNADRPLS